MLMQTRFLSPSRAAAAALVLALASTAAAQDWPQWRGPARDGVAAFDVPASWPDALQRQWSIDVGLGYATPVVVGDRLYMFTRQGGDEVMTAHDAATGGEIWRTAYPAPFTMNPATAPHREGPKGTPAYADGRLFAHGITGIFTAYAADTGRQLWQVPGRDVEPLYHTSQSPIVDGDLVILHVGGHDDGELAAFDVADGSVRWSWDGDGPAYGSPMIFEVGGTRQVVVFAQEHFVGVSLETGALLWSRPFTTRSTTTSQTPLMHGDLLIQNGRGNGVTAFRVTEGAGGWTTEDVWHTDEVSLHMANPVAHDGVLYGLSHLNSGQYFGLDLDTGEVLWTSDPRQADHASIQRAGSTIFSLEDDAELVVLGHSRSMFNPLRRYDVADSETWTQPTFSGNRIYVKDISTLTLWTVE